MDAIQAMAGDGGRTARRRKLNSGNQGRRRWIYIRSDFDRLADGGCLIRAVVDAQFYGFFTARTVFARHPIVAIRPGIGIVFIAATGFLNDRIHHRAREQCLRVHRPDRQHQ